MTVLNALAHAAARRRRPGQTLPQRARRERPVSRRGGGPHAAQTTGCGRRGAARGPGGEQAAGPSARPTPQRRERGPQAEAQTQAAGPHAPAGAGTRRRPRRRGQAEDHAQASWQTRAGAMAGGPRRVPEAGGASGAPRPACGRRCAAAPRADNTGNAPGHVQRPAAAAAASSSTAPRGPSPRPPLAGVAWG